MHHCSSAALRNLSMIRRKQPKDTGCDACRAQHRSSRINILVCSQAAADLKNLDSCTSNAAALHDRSNDTNGTTSELWSRRVQQQAPSRAAT
jgi:hypothetical protein